MTLKLAKEIAGTLGFPSKMPGTSYGLPARACLAGAKLAKVAGSICSNCYALRDHYGYPNVVKGQQTRLDGLQHPRWREAMVALLLRAHRGERVQHRFGWNATGYHRWHDSGDLQSVEHLAAICDVALLTPKVQHWLPTQELGTLQRFLKAGGALPGNLLVRVSSVMVDDPVRRAWPTTASVHRRAPLDAHICPAPTQGHRCGACRACWSSGVPHVAYAEH